MQQYILAALPSLISGLMMAVAGALGGYFVGKKKTQDKEAQAMKDGVKGCCARRPWNWACTI